MGKTIFNKVKNSKIPVIKKELDDGVIAEANKDGSIYLNKNVKSGTPLEKEAIAHEMVHINQMKRGDLNYDDDNVYWKGKKYSRKQMNEGSKQLPWEKEAYDKTDHIDGSSTINEKHMKKSKSSPNKIIFQQGSTRLSGRTLGQRASILSDELRQKADKHAAIGEQVGKIQKQLYNDEFDQSEGLSNPQAGEDLSNTNDNTDDNVETSNQMNYKSKNKNPMKMKATPITMKAKPAPTKILGAIAGAVGPALVKGAVGAIGSKLGKKVASGLMMKEQSPLKIETTSTREFKGNLGDKSGTFTETTTTKKGKKYKGTGKSTRELWDMNNKNVQSKYDTFEEFDKAAKEYIAGYNEDDQITVKTDFKKDTEQKTTQEPGTPGTPDKYNMGYYESMDAKYGAGVRNRGRKKLERILKRAGNKFDRGKGGINPETGERFENKADYLKYVSKSYGAEYNIPVGKTRLGTPGTEAGPEVTTTSDVAANPDQDTYVINDDGTTTKVDPAASMSKKSKNKGPFKMKGFSGFQNK
mgnify:CR=1 FL=1